MPLLSVHSHQPDYFGQARQQQTKAVCAGLADEDKGEWQMTEGRVIAQAAVCLITTRLGRRDAGLRVLVNVSPRHFWLIKKLGGKTTY